MILVGGAHPTKRTIMDLEIDIECRGCGLFYREGFRAMPHGMALRCPFCHSPALAIGGHAFVEREVEPDPFELSPGERPSKRKIKL